MRISDQLSAVNAGDQTTVVAPVVRDTSPNPLTAANTLADIEQSGYRLRRIVGKFWCFADQLSDPNAAAVVVVTAGFIILRTLDQTGLPLNTNVQDYQTSSILNTQDPWIWRRSWILTKNSSPFNNFAAPFPQAGGNMVTFANSNVSVGGNADGPHIDQKTARVIGPEERLFLVVTTTAVVAATDAQAGPLLLDYVYDVRILASMRSNVGNRGNASR